MGTVPQSLAIVEEKERSSEHVCHANAMTVTVATHFTPWTKAGQVVMHLPHVQVLTLKYFSDFPTP